mgnify:FL=1
MDVKDFCTGIQHIGIPTNNIEETICFYEQLGFHVALLTKNKDEAVAFLQMHNLIIETYENKSAIMQAGAIDHIALDVKNIDALFELVKMKHFHILDEQVNSLPFWEHGVRFFTIVGPNKEKIEFCEKL